MRKNTFIRILFVCAMLLCILLVSACTNGNTPQVSNSDVISSADTSKPVVKEDKPKYLEQGSTPNVGDIVLFGVFEQDNNEQTTNEPIEWIVLEVENGQALLISKYCLDRRPFNKDYGEVIWEYSYLRNWLNKDFYKAAFSEEEQERIVLSLVTSDVNGVYGTKGGRDTQDKVYILSVTEARKYFATDKERATDATEYAKSQKGYIDPDYEGCWWWLRTVGFRNEYITNVRYDGLVGESGQGIDAPDHCVRPVIRVSL